MRFHDEVGTCHVQIRGSVSVEKVEPRHKPRLRSRECKDINIGRENDSGAAFKDTPIATIATSAETTTSRATEKVLSTRRSCSPSRTQELL